MRPVKEQLYVPASLSCTSVIVSFEMVPELSSSLVDARSFTKAGPDQVNCDPCGALVTIQYNSNLDSLATVCSLRFGRNSIGALVPVM